MDDCLVWVGPGKKGKTAEGTIALASGSDSYVAASSILAHSRLLCRTFTLPSLSTVFMVDR